jgi:hypothetical protein
MSQGEWARTPRMIELVKKMMADSWPWTTRQTFYQFVVLPDHVKDTIGGFPNNRNSYQKISGLLTKARESGRIPWEWIVDKSRPTYPGRGGYRCGPAEYLRRWLLGGNDYHRDYTETQPRLIQVWLEKDALSTTVEKATYPLGVDLVCSRGYSSASKSKEVANELQAAADVGKEIVILYLGDHDGSGLDIQKAMTAKVREYSRVKFSITRLGILPGDIKKFNLPTQKVKADDPRTEEFRKKHGDRVVELDALPPAELQRRVHDAIVALIDQKAWQAAIEREKREKRTVEKYLEKFRELLPKKS